MTKRTVLALTFAALATVAAAEGYKLGYGEGEIDPQLANAAVRTNNAVIVDGMFYEVGYGEGQVDPRLAAAIKH